MKSLSFKTAFTITIGISFEIKCQKIFKYCVSRALQNVVQLVLVWSKADLFGVKRT